MTSSTRSFFKHIGFLMLIMAFSLATQAQKVVDFKTKNSTNSVERTAMLDLLRAKMKVDEKLEFKYVVDHFKVSGNFAWLKATAQRKDGKALQLEDGYDCCHVECLFKKVDGKWTILEYAAFSTDVWWEGIGERLGAPEGIF